MLGSFSRATGATFIFYYIYFLFCRPVGCCRALWRAVFLALRSQRTQRLFLLYLFSFLQASWLLLGFIACSIFRATVATNATIFQLYMFLCLSSFFLLYGLIVNSRNGRNDRNGCFNCKCFYVGHICSCFVA